ncbi:hypothetical protein LPJ53_000945 [Coemansia erecta]|uniref:Uncharacterized protein n=1 Tax=Coemansia erecta TaxID=147472 RepID=A0A9W8CTB1_9FUNG|nr:hypothetical protein LPJ53_000945 [Coemansia erecta]
MRLFQATLGLFALVAATTAVKAQADVHGRSHSGKAEPASNHLTEKSMVYSLNLLNKMNMYISKVSYSKGRNRVGATDRISLASLGLDSPGSSKTVGDLNNQIHVKLSDKYQYPFHAAPWSLTGSKALVDTSTKGNMLMMPFSDIFELEPNGIKYVASLLETFSYIDPPNAKMLAPMFGISSNSLHSPESTKAVAHMLNAVGNMGTDTLAYITRASSISASNDPLVSKGSIITLSNLLAIDANRLKLVTDLFDSFSLMNAPEFEKFLQRAGWKTLSTVKPSTSQTGATGDAIPNMSYLVPMKDEILRKMAQVAKSYAVHEPESEKALDVLKLDILQYLNEARSFWQNLTESFPIASLLNLSNNPYIGEIFQILTIASKNPGASIWQIALLYYKSIGMPGLQSFLDAPSQYVGGLASSVIGGYVSDIVTNFVGSLLELSPSAPTPSPTASPAISSPTPSMTQPAMPASSVLPSSPSKTSSSSSSVSSSSTQLAVVPAITPVPTSSVSPMWTSASSSSKPSASVSASPASSSSASSNWSTSATAQVAPSTSQAQATSAATTSTPLRSTSTSAPPIIASSVTPTPTASVPTSSPTAVAASPSSTKTPAATSASTSTSSSTTSSAYDFWGFLSYFSPGKPNIPGNPGAPTVMPASTSTTYVRGTVVIVHSSPQATHMSVPVSVATVSHMSAAALSQLRLDYGY